jgi:hypothetical protein
MFMQNFFSLYPAGPIFDLFQEKIKIFLKKIKNFPKLKIVLNRDSQKASFTKF